MGKVSIKKNIKPKKITTKKTIKTKKKVIKDKDKDQTQSQNVIVNINDTITKKRRGRPTKKAQEVKKPIQQPIAPVIQSFNQPTFKQPTPQPSLATSILASQEKPNIMSKEIKQETAIQKALVEQNTQTEEAIPKVNELERVKKERIKKLDKPIEGAFNMTPYEENKSLRLSLLSQHLADVGDDTEEINNLRTGGLFSSSPIITNPLSGLKTPNIPNPLSGVKIPKISNPLSGVSIPNIPNPLPTITNYLDSFLDEEVAQPINEYEGGVEESKGEEPESQSLLSNSSNVPTNISSLLSSGESTPTPLSQPVNPQTLQDKLDEIEETKEETFLQETKDDEPIIEKSGEAQANEAINLIQGILKPVETTPTILETPKQEPTITQTLQEEEIPLVRKKKTKKAEKQSLQAEEPTPALELKNPDIEGEEVETGQQLVKSKKTKKEEGPKITVSLIQVETKWRELQTKGLVKNRTRTPNFDNPSKTAKGKQELLDEIREIDPEWEKQFYK